MSASPPKADISLTSRHVCFVPKADILVFRFCGLSLMALEKGPRFGRMYVGRGYKQQSRASSVKKSRTTPTAITTKITLNGKRGASNKSTF